MTRKEKKAASSRAESYLYASSRVRALEGKTLPAEKLLAMSDASSPEELASMLKDASVVKEGEPLRDALSRRWEETVEEVFSLIPGGDEKTFSLLLLPYACHNVKTALKGKLGGKKTKDLLLFCPVFTPGQAEAAAEERDFSSLPPKMADAAARAVEEFEKTGDPRRIDVLLDSGCFADMADIAAADPDPFFSSYVRKKADAVDLMIACRLLRMQSPPDSEEAAREELIPLGELYPSLPSLIVSGKEAFSAFLLHTGYRKIGSLFEEGRRLSEIEKACDTLLLEQTREAGSELYGPAVPAVRLLAAEFEMKNLRILSLGVESRQSGEEIRARLRI